MTSSAPHIADAENTAWFDQAVATLTDPADLRVWSVIVSLFGDLARAPQARLGGAALLAVIAPLGIKPEAIRVALHRLRKDGWLDSQRNGRASAHFLTEFGRRQSDAVSPRIYARTPDVPTDWHLLLAEDSGDTQFLDELLASDSHVALGRNAALGPGLPPSPAEGLLALVVTPQTVPDWAQDRICPPDLADAAAALDRALSECGLPPPDLALSPRQIATLRTVVVHRWRRIALRAPDMPAAWFPAHWTGDRCRDRVFDLLDRLPRPAPKDLDLPEQT